MHGASSSSHVLVLTAENRNPTTACPLLSSTTAHDFRTEVNMFMLWPIKLLADCSTLNWKREK